jgi:exosortase
LRKLAQWSTPFVVFGALWYLLVWQLSQYWAVAPEYSYGWFVPVLCAYLFLMRWRSRPPPAEVPSSRGSGWIFSVAGFALLPTWVVAQSNPEWRLISWLLAIETVALSLCAIYFVGGTSWLRHFAFSVCLILTAVPWPGAVEEAVVHGLMQASTAVTVSALKLFHIHAIQRGNLIELKTGLIGIDEACSGIQSLQAACMFSVFLGELHRASVLQRSILVLCAAVIALLCNAGRTLLLAVVAVKEGTELIANWHDPVGYGILLTCFLLIWGMARLISEPLPKVVPAGAIALTRRPPGLIFALGGWILLTVVGTEIWYRGHEATETPRWSFAWPVYKREYGDIPISKPEADALLFDEGHEAEWTNGDGSHWTACFFRWAEGPSRSRILARAHRPENCFPGAGYKLCGDHGVIIVQPKGLSIPFHALDFEEGKDKEYVFFCLWEEGSKNSGRPRIEDKWSRLASLRSVLLGQRHLGQQSLEIVISGYDSPERAETAFRREIVTLIQAGTNDIVANPSKP